MNDNEYTQSKLSTIIGLIIILSLVSIVFVVVYSYDANKNKSSGSIIIEKTSTPVPTKLPGQETAKPDDSATPVTTATVAPTSAVPTTAPATKAPVTKAPATKAPATKTPASKAPTKTPVATPKPTVKPVKGETLGISNTEINQYYSESVFIGDSVMYGFQLYAMRQPSGFLGNPDFLVAESFSARWAMLPVTNKSVHPKYQGVKRSIFDSLKIIKPKRVFFFFGLNDLGSGVDLAYNNYMKVINKMKSDFPNIEINFVSTTPMYKGSEKRNLNNKNINALNDRLKKYCETHSNAYFFDIASYLKDGDGCLAKQFCSDRYVHQTNTAYKVWEARLKEYAAQRITQMKEEEAAKATKSPATKAPATKAPATKAPATKAPATKTPATKSPATLAPTTQPPATVTPTTEPTATEVPASEAPAPSQEPTE